MASCNGVPDYVIQPDDMAELMADIHTAEAAIDQNYSDFREDSDRIVIKRAILERHGVSQAKMDTSLVWYGAHLTKFMDVYDDAAEIIQRRIDRNSAVAAQQASLSLSGDSVDVWNDSRRLLFSPQSAARTVSFAFSHDDNWEPGDMYTWRVKFLSDPGRSQWGLAATYDSGAVEVLNNSFDKEGWQEITFVTDSTQQANELRGYILIGNANRPVYVDSVQIIRKRLSVKEYNKRYRQRKYKF